MVRFQCARGENVSLRTYRRKANERRYRFIQQKHRVRSHGFRSSEIRQIRSCSNDDEIFLSAKLSRIAMIRRMLAKIVDSPNMLSIAQIL